MKRVNNLYNKICDIDVIMEMYDKVVRVNTKNKRKIQKFDDYYSCNIVKIKESLINKKYEIGKYNIFLTREPKVRVIMSQEIEDKIVNHLVAKYFFIDAFDKTLIDRNCATRIGKGSHYALKIFKNDYNKMLNKYGKFYILKLDISKFFYSLDHEIIKEIIKRKIKDKNVIDIIEKIIDSTNEDYINSQIIKLVDNEKKKIFKLKEGKERDVKLQELNNIPLYENGKGVCIGNMVSQVIATVYLDELDKYITNELGIKEYCRYMDDFYCMSNNKMFLKEVLVKISEFVKRYKLKLNNKTKIYTNLENVEFLGFVFFTINGNIRMKLTNKTKKRFKYKMKWLDDSVKKGRISLNQYDGVVASYSGHLSYGDCYGLYKKYRY